MAAVRRSIDRRNVEEDELAGFRQRPAQLIPCARQLSLLVRPRSLHFALKAGVHQFEIKHRSFGGSARAGAETISVNAMRTKAGFMIRTGEIHGSGGKMPVAR